MPSVLGTRNRPLHLLPSRRASIAGILGGILLAIAFLASGTRKANQWCGENALACNFTTDSVFAAGIGLVGYFGVIGLQGERLLRYYATRLRDDPAAVGGFPSHSRTWTAWDWFVDQLIQDINLRRHSGLILLKGAPGSGKTEILLRLLSRLDTKRTLPVPISIRRLAVDELVDSARSTFLRTVDPAARGSDQSDRIWRRLRSTHDLVIVVDDLGTVLDGLSGRQAELLLKSVRQLSTQHRLTIVATLEQAPPPLFAKSVWEIPPVPATFYAEMLAGDNAPDALSAVRGDLITKYPSLRIPSLLSVLSHTPEAVLAKAVIACDEIHALATIFDDSFRRLNELDERTDKPTTLAHLCKLAFEENRWSALDGPPANRMTGAILRELESAVRLGLTLGILRSGSTPTGVKFSSLQVKHYLAGRHLASSGINCLCELLDSADQPAALAPLAYGSYYLQSIQDDDKQALAESLERLRKRSEPLALIAFFEIQRSESNLVNSRDSGFSSFLTVGTWSQDEAEALSRALAAHNTPESARVLWQLCLHPLFSVRSEAARRIVSTSSDRTNALAETFDIEIAKVEDALDSGKVLPTDLPVGVCAWLLPSMDIETVSGQMSLLERLLKLVPSIDPLLLEQSLGRGLKLWSIYGSNHDAFVTTWARVFGHMTFWSARLNAIQALAIVASKATGAKRLSLIQSLVESVDPADHPLVVAAADVCARGISEASSWRLWAWEAEVDLVAPAGRDLSAEALMLGADIALLTNLIFSQDADSTWVRQRRPEYPLWVSKPTLPECLSSRSGREALWVSCPESCAFKLCPYPSAEALGVRVELDDDFARLIRHVVMEVGVPRWTSASKAEL